MGTMKTNLQCIDAQSGEGQVSLVVGHHVCSGVRSSYSAFFPLAAERESPEADRSAPVRLSS